MKSKRSDEPPDCEKSSSTQKALMRRFGRRLTAEKLGRLLECPKAL
jgi:hypothetical protein